MGTEGTEGTDFGVRSLTRCTREGFLCEVGRGLIVWRCCNGLEPAAAGSYVSDGRAPPRQRPASGARWVHNPTEQKHSLTLWGCRGRRPGTRVAGVAPP